MANIVSPGVYVIEKDISNYPATIDSTTVGVVGFAQKGPTNKATLITSQERLINTFGDPTDSTTGHGILGSLEILEATNRLYYVRAVSDDAKQASATVHFGACPAIAVSSNSYGVNTPITFKVMVTDHTGASAFPFLKTYSIPATAGGDNKFKDQQTALANAFGTDMDDLKVVAAYPFTTDSNNNVIAGSIASEAGFLVGSFAGSGATLYVSASENALLPLDASGNPVGTGVKELTVSGATISSNSLNYLVESLYPGAGYNLGTTSDGAVSGNSVEIDAKGGANFIVTVNDRGAIAESFKASLINNKSFLTDTINTAEDNAVSDYIQGNVVESGAEITPEKMGAFADQITALITGNTVTMTSGTSQVPEAIPRFVKLVQGTYKLDGGSNGAPTTGFQQYIIGDPSQKSGIYALDNDQLNLTIGVIPGISDARVQNALITLAETSQNFIACVSPPYGKDTPQEAIDWANGFSQERSSAINSSYVAIYWPWLKTFVPTIGNDVWIDPAVYGARQIAYTAGVAELWFAPAGFIRGRLTKPLQTEAILNQGDRDSLYSGGNAINPIVNFPQQGITIFGQRTAQRDPTALDRINVRMLMIYIRKVLLLSTQRFAFEPNDAILWAQIEETVNPLLDDIKRRRGITQFKVICDETVNTPVRVDRNEVWCKILIKPTKAAEAVVFELNVTSQSAKIVG